MELKMELKTEQSGIRLPSPRPSSTASSSSPTLSPSSSNGDDDSESVGGDGIRGTRLKRISLHFHHLNSNLMLFLLLLFATNRIFSLVEGNGEIESCVRVMHSGVQSPNSGVGASAIMDDSGYIGSSGRLGGGGNGNHLLVGNGGGGSSSGGSEHSVILCQIRTLHPDLDIENLTSSIPTGTGGFVDVMTITKIKLVCNDVLFFESEVSPGQLSGLVQLTEVVIDKCKLKHIPADFLSGLRHLRKLSISTGNSEWAARSLEISPGAFAQVPLRHLHLSSNNIWNLPERLLCLGSLQTLNLSHNLLSDIDDLGLPGGGVVSRVLPLQNEYSTPFRTVSPVGVGASMGDGCLGDLKSFDLSYNSLRTIGSRRLESMRRLTEFRLEHNVLGIEEFEEGAFFGLLSLRLLNLSSNRIVALPSKLLQPCKLLSSVDFRNNSLTSLAPGLFDNLEHLTTLDLSMNSLSSQWITSEAFKSLVRLVFLNLSNNQLTHVSPKTFQDLIQLQSLDLSQNLISFISDGTFSSMKNLHSLNLGRNRLVDINANSLNGLYVISKLILDYNQISNIEAGALKNCTSLQDLGLVANKLTSVPSALGGLTYLRTLDLGENRISILTNESFAGMSQLYGLRLVDNLIEEVPEGLCNSVPRLRVCNLAQNKIHKIESTAFSACSSLKVLRLDSNQLKELPVTLAPQLPSLLWLNVSKNSLRVVDYHQLPPTLEWLDLSYNSIETLGGTVSSRLRVVDASHNQLTQLDAVPASLEVLRLSHNKLNKIFPDTFSHSAHLRRVELIGNQLENIPLSALQLPPIAVGKPLPEFFLGGNPLLCNCEMEWLTRINQLSALRQHPQVLDLDALVCRVSYSRTVTHIPLPDIKPQDFLCPYKSHCFALCHCCDFDACDCEMTCPSNCTCYHDDTWAANVVNCASSGTTSIPSRLPMDSTEIYLDGNKIPSINSHVFIGRKNLKVLYLNNSKVEHIRNKSFNGLQSLKRLHLEGNLLTELHGYEFQHLYSVTELYLQDNQITSMANTTFLPLKSLEILRLDGNRLITFTVWQLSLNPYLVEIALARNQWNCDCQFLHQLYGWVTDNSRKVIDLGQLQCVWNTTHKPGPHLIDYNRTCGSSWAMMGIDGGDFTFSPLPLIFGFVSLILLIIIILIVLILCRDNARLFLFSQFGIRMCSSHSDDEKLYDAYLVYSQKDEEFVAQKIADELEANDSYKLCLHYRDLISETGDLKEMMVGAVENSKSVVVILSRNFLQGEWASGEYRGAFQAVLKKSQKNSIQSKKVVIVFIDDMNPLDVAPDIRSWVRHNRIQVIKWSLSSPDQRKQRKFWSKLKYSLPAPSSHYHSNITSNTTTATSASSNESSTGGIMATLKYSSNNENEQHQIIVDEYNRTLTMNINNKLWPYGSSNFVALPPKYQIPNSPGNHSQTGTIASHLSLNNYNQSIHGQSSPLHHHHHHPNNHHHYHPPALPLSNPPKSPPSTDSTTTTNGGGDENGGTLHNPTSFSLMFQQMQQLQQQQHKSPVPVPKLYSSPNVNNGVLITSSNGGGGLNSNSSNHGGGESYLSLEGEHVYSTLDPPSPQAHQTHHPHHQTHTPTNNRLLNNIHLPNGYTYQPQMTVAPQQQSQWHPSPNNASIPKGRDSITYSSAKNSKTQKEGSNNPVQTYLV